MSPACCWRKWMSRLAASASSCRAAPSQGWSKTLATRTTPSSRGYSPLLLGYAKSNIVKKKPGRSRAFGLRNDYLLVLALAAVFEDLAFFAVFTSPFLADFAEGLAGFVVVLVVRLGADGGGYRIAAEARGVKAAAINARSNFFDVASPGGAW